MHILVIVNAALYDLEISKVRHAVRLSLNSNRSAFYRFQLFIVFRFVKIDIKVLKALHA